MKKGCLSLLLLFLVTCVIEWQALRHFKPDVPEPLAIPIALLVIAAVANLYGVYAALKQKRLLAKEPSEWREGDLIGVSGRLSATRAPLTAPGSGRQVALYEYEVKRVVVSGSGKNRSTTHVTDFMGFGMAPCAVQTSRGGLKLVGFPMLVHFDRTILQDQDLERMYHYLSSATFTLRAKGLRGALSQINEVLGDDDGDLRLDLRDPDAVREPPVPPHYQEGKGASGPTTMPIAGDTKSHDEADEDEMEPLSTSLQWFGDAGYTVEQRSIENGSHITVFGTYHMNPQRIDVGGILQNMSHQVFPGEGAAVASKNLIKAMIALSIFGALAIAVHYYLYPALFAV